MRRLSFAVVCLAWLPFAAQAEESLSPKMVAAVKAATVFVKIKSKELAGSGSGFVIRVDGDTAYIVTNRHVVEPKVAEIVVERRPGGSRGGYGRRRGMPGFPQPMVPQPPFPFPVPGQQNEEPRYSARVLVREFKNVEVTAVLQSGTTHEESVLGKIVAIDPDEDIAVVKVSGIKQPPKTIDYTHEPSLAETMPIYTFGFPLGDELSTGKRSPAITVGKGSVSSLRTDDDGNLAMVQLDAALNHGNSGGPVVDAQGRLVGVAVARITEAESQNIGVAIPSRAVTRLLHGRVDKAVLTLVKESDDKVSIQVTAAVIDPLGTIKSAKLQYLSAKAITDKPKPAESLEKLAGCRTLELKVEDGVASGKIVLKKGVTEVSLLHQSLLIDGSGKRVVSESALNRVALATTPPALPPGAANSAPLVITGQKAAARPAGSIGIHFVGRSTPFRGTGGVVPMPNWNNEAGTAFNKVALTDNSGANSGVTFSLVNALANPWSTGSRNELLNGYVGTVNFQPMTLTLNGVPYAKYSLYIYVGNAELHDDAKVTINGTTYYHSPMGGEPVGYTRVTSTNPTVQQLGNYIEVDGLSGASQTVVMAGTTQQYSGLCSVEIVDTSTDAGVAKASPAATAPANQNSAVVPPALTFPPNPGSAGARPPLRRGVRPSTQPGNPALGAGAQEQIFGGRFGPQFRDAAPPKGMLVGFEVGLGKWGPNDIVAAFRPIFVNEQGEEVMGEKHGTDFSRPVTVKAKMGYAVGAIAAKSVIAVDAFSLTFMKIDKDHLDPSDKYESEWIGGGGTLAAVTASGNGKPAIGIVGHANNKDCSALGLTFAP